MAIEIVDFHPRTCFLCEMVGAGGPEKAFFSPKKSSEIRPFLFLSFYSEFIFGAMLI